MTIGLESWFSNFTQLSQKWNSPDTLVDIPRPYVEYGIWGLFKGGELSSLVGGLLAHPIYRIYLKSQLTPETTTPNSHKIIRNSCRRLQGRFLLAGIALGPSLAIVHALTISEKELRDRCYRIRCDTIGLTYDRAAFVCGFLGWYWKRFQGAVDGINVGLTYALLDTAVLRQHTSPLLKDKLSSSEMYPSVEEGQKYRSRLTHFFYELDSKPAEPKKEPEIVEK